MSLYIDSKQIFLCLLGSKRRRIRRSTNPCNFKDLKSGGKGEGEVFAEPLAQKGKVDDPAKVDSSAITPTSNRLDIAQQTSTCSSQTANFSVNRGEPGNPEHNRVRNVPSGAKDLVTQAHFGSQSQLTKRRSQPQRHAHDTSAKFTNSAPLDLSTFNLQVRIFCTSPESTKTTTPHAPDTEYILRVPVKETNMPPAPATGAAGLLARQLKGMQQAKDLPGISCGLVNDNVFEWEVMLMISDDCKYYGGRYPSSPTFITRAGC
jgi:hypothetical protein